MFPLLSVLMMSTASSASADPAEFFESKIRPVFVEHCLSCHGGDPAKEPKGGLRIDSLAALLKGGDSGPALVAGDPAKSRILEAMKFGNTDLQMPPKGKLPDAIIRDVETWIKAGAVWPGTATKSESKNGFDLAKRKSEHWYWKPLSNNRPSHNKGDDSNPIDQFIREPLTAAGIKPNHPADPATLLRRLSFDLTGLPPSQGDVEFILKDPQSYPKFVEKYLNSPQYGERWARHWLDLARYADTRGHEFDHPIPYAWRYRDYVIRAINKDLRYRDFVTEQIAGDVLPKPRLHADGSNESIQGTGFWLLGEEIHSPVDVRQDQADRFDNRIDVFGKTYLGLTIACARCHDHKFDAISTKDYYSLFTLLEASSPRFARIDSETRITTLKRGEWQSDGDAYVETDSHITFDRTKGNIRIKDAREVEAGELGKYDRTGKVLRSRQFTIQEGKFYILMSGGAVSYAPVGHHTLISGPLHGSLVREFSFRSNWRWECHDLTQYRGQTTHFEFSPQTNSEFSIAVIVQANEPPAVSSEFKLIATSAATKEKPKTSEPDSSRLSLALWEGPAMTDRVFVRGSPRNLGEETPPRFLEALAGNQRLEGGRLALAKQMTDDRLTPQLYRVFANRVWYHLMGRGIVSSVDNFGVLGEKPSHPELLDYLAGIARDATPKELIRRIVLSNTYKMSSLEISESELKDPGNQLFHRQQLRRIDSESIRDAMLAITNRIDLKQFGPAVPVYVSDFQDGRGKPKSGPLDGDGRRSIYIRVQRNFLSPMQLAFDAPIPFSTVGKRQVSNVPAQALILLNDEFVNQQAKRWGELISKLEPAERIPAMYLSAFGRLPTSNEVKACQEYLNEKKDNASLGHALFNVKEFTYLP